MKLSLAALCLVGCTSATSQIYFEPSIQRQVVSIRRVAIVPNRLPLNLQNAEYWTRTNWRIAADEFRHHGFDVIDYDTSVAEFNRSGLPVEDTKSSRDKYADLAEKLGVDAIVVPYYGTFTSAATFLFSTRVSHISVVTFQIFLADKNDFLSRVDASGKWTWVTNILMIPGMAFGAGGAVLGASATPESSKGHAGIALASVGGAILGVGLLMDLVVAAIPDDQKWEWAFREGIHDGLRPFFASFPSPFGTRTPHQMPRPVILPTPVSALPAATTASPAPLPSPLPSAPATATPPEAN